MNFNMHYRQMKIKIPCKPFLKTLSSPQTYIHNSYPPNWIVICSASQPIWIVTCLSRFSTGSRLIVTSLILTFVFINFPLFHCSAAPCSSFSSFITCSHGSCGECLDRTRKLLLCGGRWLTLFEKSWMHTEWIMIHQILETTLTASSLRWKK